VGQVEKENGVRRATESLAEAGQVLVGYERGT
jgi:hypothetical protein